MKSSIVILLALLFIYGCSRDIPEPEVHHQEHENIDPIQMEYKLHEPHV